MTLDQLTNRLRQTADFIETLAAAGLLQAGDAPCQPKHPAASDQRRQRPRRTTEPAIAAPAQDNAAADAPLPAGRAKPKATGRLSKQRKAEIRAAVLAPENADRTAIDLARELNTSDATIRRMRREAATPAAETSEGEASDDEDEPAAEACGALSLPAGYIATDPDACNAIRRHGRLTLSGIHNVSGIPFHRLKSARRELLKATCVRRGVAINLLPLDERQLYRRMNRILKRCDRQGVEPTPEEDRFVQELIRAGCRDVQAGWLDNDERKRRTGLNADEKDPDEYWLPPRAMAGVN